MLLAADVSRIAPVLRTVIFFMLFLLSVFRRCWPRPQPANPIDRKSFVRGARAGLGAVVKRRGMHERAVSAILEYEW
jgi:hypothetical protein